MYLHKPRPEFCVTQIACCIAATIQQENTYFRPLVGCLAEYFMPSHTQTARVGEIQPKQPTIGFHKKQLFTVLSRKNLS